MDFSVVASDKSSLLDSDSKGDGAVPSATTIMCEFCGRRKAKYYLPRLKKWCCSKRRSMCKGGVKSGPFICKNCGREHSGEYGSGDYCSNQCSKEANLKKGYDSPKLKEHYADNSWRGVKGKENKCPECDMVFSSRRVLREHRIEKHNMIPGKFGWAKDSKKWKESIEKGKNTRRQRMLAGEYKSLFGGRHHTIETREKLSRIATERLLNNENTGRRPDVKWYKVKNPQGEVFSNQGTWERDFAEWLTTKNIMWKKRVTIPFVSSDGLHKTYIPDFYLPETDEYVEIKGLFTEDDKRKMNDVVASNPSKRIYFLHGRKVVYGFIKGNMEFNESLIYKIM